MELISYLATQEPCPICGAEQGQGCTQRSGNRTSPHFARRSAARRRLKTRSTRSTD